jgi:hypothetical protein
MKTNALVLVLVLLLPHTVHVDRITRMNQSDLCIYGDLVYEACMNGKPL